jgi:hypothetical protein
MSLTSLWRERGCLLYFLCTENNKEPNTSMDVDVSKPAEEPAAPKARNPFLKAAQGTSA